MTYTPQNKANSIMDTLEGVISDWYDQVDGLLKASEFIPGNYEYSQNIAYSNSNEFREGGQTHVDISCDRFKIISLDNSYIDIEMNFPIKTPNFVAKSSSYTLIKPKYWYIGFKSVFDVIDQYRIYSNSDLIQTQNHANYESWLQYISISDDAKMNSECYATWDKIQKMDEDVPGIYIKADNLAVEQVINVPLHLKIPLNQFLMLANLKWFPGFFGKMTLEIYPSYRNLVVCPVLQDFIDEHEDSTGTSYKRSELASLVDTTKEIGSNPFGFTQINGDLYIPQYNNSDETKKMLTEIATRFACSDSTTKRCHIYTAETVVRMDVYNEIMARFVNTPMLFPIQTIITNDFSGQFPTASGSDITMAQTNALNHCNSMFVVFKKTNNDRTCFENPMINWQVNIDGKLFPRSQYQSFNDNRNMNLFLDATNFNGNSIFSVPNDIYHSLQPFVKTYEYNTAKSGNLEEKLLCYPKDRSNYAIGIPFCDDDTFQAGLHSGGTVQVELRGSRTSNFSGMYATAAPTALYVEDCILKLRSVKPAGSPQISPTNASIEQVLASGVMAN